MQGPKISGSIFRSDIIIIMVGPTIPISRIHICHECDPKRYPRGKPIMPEDTMASKDENTGEWICGPCRQEAIDSDIVKADPHSQKAQQILKKRAQETKRKLYLRIFEVRAKSKRVSARQRLVTK
jgi:hypothetical protein